MITPVCLSFRGAAGDEESRAALQRPRARFPAALGMTSHFELSQKLPSGEGVERSELGEGLAGATGCRTPTASPGQLNSQS